MIPSCYGRKDDRGARSCAASDQRTAKEVTLDLARLDRWERRAWSQQKRVILGS
jgi:hypothetical protein